METNISDSAEHNEMSSKSKVCSFECLPWKDRAVSNDLVMHLKVLEVWRHTQEEEKKILKISAINNEIDTKQTTQKINDSQLVLWKP